MSKLSASHNAMFLATFCALLFEGAASAQISLSDVIQCNNDGVKALNAKNYPLAIEMFRRAIGMDPGYKLAKENLAITFSTIGTSKEVTPKEALKWLHKAISLNLSNVTTEQNIESTIKKLGKDPKAFFDRVELDLLLVIDVQK